MWKLTEHRSPKAQQEQKVKILLLEMVEFTSVNYAESFIDRFHDRLKEIPRSNNFSPDLMFKATQRNFTSLEVWKLYPNGDFRTKLYTLDYVA